jgi:beta-galactosidase
MAPVTRGGWQELPASVTVTTGTSPDGRRVHIVHNWSWEPARAQAPVDLSDVLNDDSVPAGTDLELGPWDVRVLVRADSGS